MKPKSNTLFHFTKSLDVVKSILKEGFWPRFCLEDMCWYRSQDMPYIALPIACFCDIPLSRIDEHVGFYGEYGLGVTREWAMNNGLNPVMYVSEQSSVADSIRRQSHLNEPRSKGMLDFINIVSHVKPVKGNMFGPTGEVVKDFYQENEWRFYAKTDYENSFLYEEQFNDKQCLENANAYTKQHCSLFIGPEDIKYIFVKSDHCIPEIINYIQTELDHLSGVNQKLLMSRVISLESITEDL